jgi:predicted DNA-binding transcriptional regulator AlpA
MKLIRVGKVADKCAISIPKTWDETANNPAFPKPVKPSPGITAWVEEEVDAYLIKKVAEYREQPTKRSSVYAAAKASVTRRAGGK